MLKVEYRNYGGGSNMQQRGRVTIPTDVDVVPETLTLMERWGADAIRDCDGTDYPEELRAVDAKVYSTYYTTRKDNTWAKALLGCLLLEITRLNYTNKETRADAEQGRITCIVSRAMDYISDHYMEPIRVEQLAKYSHLSETHFRRVFTEYMHMGPLEYINTVRIRTACEHLKKTEEPVADIAHKWGFTTNSTFNRNFKQMMGVTPVEWRKRPENYEQRLLNYEIHTEKGW